MRRACNVGAPHPSPQVLAPTIAVRAAVAAVGAVTPLSSGEPDCGGTAIVTGKSRHFSRDLNSRAAK